MTRIGALSRAEFTLLGRNRLLLFNAVVLPLVFPVGILILARGGGLSDTAVASGLEMFALFLFVFVVYYNLLSVYATRRDELVLKRLRTGECSDAEILSGPAVPSWVLSAVLTLLIGVCIAGLGGRAPVNPLLVALAVAGGAALFTALALITSALTRNAEAAQITCMPVVVVATAGLTSVRDAVPDNVARLLDLTPLAAIVDILSTGWVGYPGSGSGAAADTPDRVVGFVDTVTAVGGPVLVLVAWIAVSALAARVYFRWEPRT